MERQSNKAPRLDGIVLTIAKNKTSLVHPPPYQILFKSSDLLFEKHFFFWAFFFSFFATLARNMKGEARRSPSSLFFSFSLALFFFLSLCPDECLGAKWYVRNGFEGGTGTFDHPYGNLEVFFFFLFSFLFLFCFFVLCLLSCFPFSLIFSFFFHPPLFRMPSLLLPLATKLLLFQVPLPSSFLFLFWDSCSFVFSLSSFPSLSLLLTFFLLFPRNLPT